MKKVLIVLGLFFVVNSLFAQSTNDLKVSANGHFLEKKDGTPFFWLGDTAWELFHRLTLEEIIQYLDNRQAKGFNVIQAVVLAETDGLRVPNKYGDVPLINMDPNKPNEKYFKLIDTVVKLAADRNLIMAMLPAWGDKVTLNYGGHGPVIFTKDNAYPFGKFLGERYKHFSSVLWILGGDRPPSHECNDWKPVWGAMAKGIDDGAEKHIIKSFHPGGSIWETSPLLHNTDWLDYNMIQSGHAALDVPVWQTVLRDWNLSPSKPVIDAEPCYEDHPVNPWPTWDPARGYFRDYEVRKQIYRSVFAGGFGVTYGHHSIWQFYNPTVAKINYPDRYWYEALDRPGAFQAGYLRKLMESRPFNNRITANELIIEGQGTAGEFITAFRDSLNRFIMVYIPVGKTIKLNTSSIPGKRIKVWWFNPKNMDVIDLGTVKNTQQMSFSTPTTGKGNDWILVLDNPLMKYKAPGK